MKIAAADLSKLDVYKGFVIEHSVLTTYTFETGKCGKDTCHYHSKNSVCLPSDMCKNIKFIPGPVLDSSKVHYQKFDQVYGSAPSGKDRPNLKYSFDLIEKDNLDKDVLVTQKVRAILKCALCAKLRQVTYFRTDICKTEIS